MLRFRLRIPDLLVERVRLRPYYVRAHNDRAQASIGRPVLGRLHKQPTHPAAASFGTDDQADELRLVACFHAEPVLSLNPANDRAVNFGHCDEVLAQPGQPVDARDKLLYLRGVAKLAIENAKLLGIRRSRRSDPHSAGNQR